MPEIAEMWRTHASELADDRDREKQLRLLAERALAECIKDRDRAREERDRYRDALIEAASAADEIVTTLVTEPETPAINEALGWAERIRPLLKEADSHAQ